MATVITQAGSGVTVLHGVSYKTYARLTQHPANRHLRMAYHDGTLEIVSPIYYAHEGASRRLSLIVLIVAKALGVRLNGTGGLTIHRGGEGPVKGVGKEPDQAFYIGSLDRFPSKRNLDLNAGDPPLDLWIEVDNRSSFRSRLPTYARLGTPEVWQYRVGRKSLRFFQLVEGRYVASERSLALPILTPARVLEAIIPSLDLDDTEFLTFFEAWVPAQVARVAVEPPAE